MVSYRTQRVLPVVILVVIVVVGLILLFPFISNMFTNNPVVPSEIQTSRTNLVNTSADRSVRMIVRGPIVADEDFRSFQIQISSSNRTFNLYKGYDKTSIKDISLYNNVPAYEQFVYALNNERFMDNNELTGDANDTRGVCPTGLLYTFQILTNDDVNKTLWTTSCSSERGSLRSSGTQFVTLFLKQIPKSKNIPINAQSVLGL